MRLDGNTVVNARSPDGFSFNGHWAQPNADASYIFRNGGMYSADVQPIALGDLEGHVLIPCVDPRFIVTVRASGEDKSDLAIFTVADRRRLVTVPGVEHVTAGVISTVQGRLHDEFRVHFLPQMNRIALVPQPSDKVVVRQVDLIDSIRRSGSDYLYVLSSPPTIVGIGDTMRYPIEVVSSGGAPEYKLISGPKDMIVEGTGLVRWTVRNKRLGDKEKIVISVKDAKGQEQFHTWDVIVVSGTPILHKLRRAEVADADPATKGKFRTWSDKSKAFQVEAEFVRSSLGKVTLKTRDGRFLTVQLAQLCDADQLYVRERLGNDK
jgi:hypothetical protein